MNEIYPIDFKWEPIVNPYTTSGRFGWLHHYKPNDTTINYEPSWEGCREMFTWHYIRQDIVPEWLEFAFLHSGIQGLGNQGLNLAKFINEVENRLQLEDRTKIHGFTNYSQASIIFPSKWWFENQLRIQLFSILIRCGGHYEGDFEATLNAYSYAADTKKAIYKFLEGFTNWGGVFSVKPTADQAEPKEMNWKRGWFHFFSGGANLDLLIK